MATIITLTGTAVTHDETEGLQNPFNTPNEPRDADDDDVVVGTLPGVFSTRLANLGFDPNGAIDAAVSSGNVIDINGTGITDLAFTDANGDPLDGDSSGLFTTEGDEVFLFTDDNNNIVLGKTSSGAIVFAIFLAETGTPVTGARLWTIQFQSLNHGDPTDPDDILDLTNRLFVTADQAQEFSFAGAPSGQNLFLAIGDASGSADGIQIVVTGKNPANQSETGGLQGGDTINTSQGGGTTTIGVNNQMFNPGEGAYFTFVKGMPTTHVVPNLDQNEADVEANIDFQSLAPDITSASFTISQTQPASKTVTVQISAFTTASEPGANFIDGLTNDTAVAISAVQVNGQNAGTIVNGVATITGLKAGDVVTYTTSGDHNRVLIENPTGATNNFDIGGFSLPQTAQETEDVGLRVLFEDDAPVASGATESATVQEDDLAVADGDLSDGIDEAGDPPTDEASGTVAALVTAGADEPATFTLAADTSGLPSLTSKGEAVSYGVLGDTLTATAGGRTVFTLTLATNGDYTFNLQDQLDHNDGGDLATLAIDLSSVIVATDFDGDSVTPPANAFVINVENDVPVASVATESALVQEDDLAVADGDLSDGIDEAGDPPTDEASGTVAALVTAGADEPATFTLAADTSGLPSLTSKGEAVSYGVLGDTLTATAGGRTVFTLTLATNGDYTFNLQDQLDHADGGDSAILPIDLSSVIVATDFDGDSVTPPAEAFVINVENDVPVASVATESATVQEDDLAVADGDLSDGIDEAGDPPTDEASGTVAALVTAGADEPATFALAADTSGLPSLTSKGEAVSYGVLGDTLTATAGGRTVFTLTLATNGDYTFNLQDQLDHNDGGDLATLAIDLSSVIVATDFDGDSVTPPAEAFVINVENDVPAIGPIADGLVDFADGDSVTNSLNGTPGADEPASFTVTSSPATVTLFDGTSAELTLLRDISGGGTVVTYFDDADGSGTLNTDDTEFFKLTVSGGNYTFDVLQDPPPAMLEFNFDFLPSGSNLFGVVGQTDSAIVVIGRDPVLDSDGEPTNQSDVIHTSQGGINATIGVNNQMFDPGDGAFFTYVHDPNPDFLSGAPGGLTSTEADDADNIEYTGGTLDVSSASFTISQTQGNSLATAKISAFLMADAPQERDFVNDGLGTGGTPDITAVRVFDETGTKIEDTGDPNFDDPSVVIDLTGLTAIVSGLETGYKVEWDTASLHNQVLIEGVAGKFDIGGFAINQPQPTPDEKLDFTVEVADFDGDTDTASFSIGVDGTGIFDDDHVAGVIA